MESSRQICLMLLVSNHWCFDMCVFVRVCARRSISPLQLEKSFLHVILHFFQLKNDGIPSLYQVFPLDC